MLTIGWFGEDIADAAEDFGEWVVEGASDALDAISDAGEWIGGALKVIAPIVGLFPGIGTAFSIALTAAAAAAMGDELDDALIEIASNAIPGGVPRIAFDAGAQISQAALRGEDIGAATIDAMRRAAHEAGGDQAVAAFDTGLAVARGERVDEGAIRFAREQVAVGGVAAGAAFDAGLALAKGGDAEDVAIAVAREYAFRTGGPLALVALDTGYALSRGKNLQEAGFVALRAFARGNTLAERAESFAEAMVRAHAEGKDLEQALRDELVADVARVAPLGPYVESRLGPLMAKIYANPAVGELGSALLASGLNIEEPIVRAAQAVMRTGEIDQELLDRLTTSATASAIERFGAAVVASASVNRTYTEEVATQREERLMLAARSSVSGSFRADRAAAGNALPPATVAVVEVLDVPELVAAPSVPSSRHSLTSDLALGGVVAAAGLALFFWAKAK